VSVRVPPAAPSTDRPGAGQGLPSDTTARPARAARRAILAACAILAMLGNPIHARAGVEEFSTFSVEAQENDDESLLDHMLGRTPLAWRDEWEHSPLALRSAQGCLTSGQWANATDFKLRTAMGRHAWFGADFRQYENDQIQYEYTEFSVHVPTRIGTAGWMFRPTRDKSSQDMAFLWDLGADTSAFQLRGVFGLEDVFNNFWEFRQVVTGGRAEPYLRHPWEPGLLVIVRRPRLRAELGGRYLTPSTKRILDHVTSLWGTLGWASVEARALGLEWEVRSVNHQASSTDHPIDLPEPSGRDFRRQWTVEGAVRRRIAPRLTTEVRWLYQSRTQIHAPPVAPPRFEGVDRVVQAEAAWNATPSIVLRLGGLHDRITIQNSAVSAPLSYGSRTESRAYLAGIARVGRVNLQIIEGIELDHEPYEVWAVHDKGFLQLQATF
jgi:hypothetical protein